MQPTIILVRGAVADSSSWNDVADTLSERGQRVIAYANPLRSVAGDAAGLTELVRTIEGPIVLVGHSYGGAVITNVPADAGEIELYIQQDKYHQQFCADLPERQAEPILEAARASSPAYSET